MLKEKSWRLVVGLAACALFVLTLEWTWAHSGWKVQSTRVTIGGKHPPPDTALYRLSRGDYLLRIEETAVRTGNRGESWYALRPREQQVAFVHPGGRVEVAGTIIINSETRPSGVALNEGKANVPRPTVCRVGHFDFVSMISRERITVIW